MCRLMRPLSDLKFADIDNYYVDNDNTYEGFYNFSKVCCPTDFALNIST